VHATEDVTGENAASSNEALNPLHSTYCAVRQRTATLGDVVIEHVDFYRAACNADAV